MRYIFDWETPGSSKRLEITELMTNVHEKVKPLFGLDTGGFEFQNKRVFKPLQAADVLAWQLNAYMPKIYPREETEADLEKVHPGFRMLRENQEMHLYFFSPTNIKHWVDKVLAAESELGFIP
jgi:hypothetical protein